MSYAAVATKYAKAAAGDRKGKTYCKWVRLAAKRFLDDLARKDADFYFSEDHAADICNFVENLPHVEGVWKSQTITLEPAQVFILANVFGWRRKSDGLRRFTSAHISVARKNAKSTITAPVALYCLAAEDEPGAQVIVGATTAEQALKVFTPAKRMVERTPALREAFGLEPWARSITCQSTGGFMQTINAKGRTQDGWNPHVGILDELHAHPDRALFDVIDSAFGARRAPLMWTITTAGYNTNGVCFERETYLQKVLQGVIKADHFFGVIYTLDEGDDIFDPDVWIKANPLLGITPTLDSMQRAAADAKASPSGEAEFATKKCNIWRNAASGWLSVEAWGKCADPSLSWSDFDGLDCYAGGDLADKDDITALVLAAIDPAGRLLLKPVFWLPEAVLQQPMHVAGRGVAPYAMWAKQGYLNVTPGDWVDHNEVEDTIRRWHDRYGLRSVTFDQFAAAQAMASRLNEDLSTPDNPLASVLHKQASKVTDPAREFEARVNAGKLRHDDNPVLNWMASNVVVSRRRDETILPVKEAPNSPNKIDGIDAAINAIAPMVAVAPSVPDFDVEALFA